MPALISLTFPNLFFFLLCFPPSFLSSVFLFLHVVFFLHFLRLPASSTRFCHSRPLFSSSLCRPFPPLPPPPPLSCRFFLSSSFVFFSVCLLPFFLPPPPPLSLSLSPSFCFRAVVRRQNKELLLNKCVLMQKVVHGKAPQYLKDDSL